MQETVEVEQFIRWSIIVQYLPERATISVTERPWDINLEIIEISPSSAVGRFVSVKAYPALLESFLPNGTSQYGPPTCDQHTHYLYTNNRIFTPSD